MATGYKTAVIYKITNPNGRVYIGSTINIKRRIESYRKLRCKQQVKLYNSFIKYGFENHNIEILCICQDKDRYLFEAVYGIIFKVLCDRRGLNIRIPKISDKYESISIEARKKIGDAHRGKKLSEEQKENMRINLKKHRELYGHNLIGKTPWNKGKKFLAGELNPMYGVKRSPEWKARHSDICRIKNVRGAKHHRSRPVFDKYMGIYYDTLKEVSLSLNIKYSTLKSKMQRGNERFDYI